MSKSTKNKKPVICSLCNSEEACYINFNDGTRIPSFSISMAYGTITCNACRDELLNLCEECGAIHDEENEKMTIKEVR